MMVRRRKRRRKSPAERLRLTLEQFRALTPRDKYLRLTYNITERQYEYMLALTGGGCNICRRRPKPGRRLPVDHDHKTGRVRGALCFRCNHRLLGRGLEDARLHESAAEYLRSDCDGRRVGF